MKRKKHMAENCQGSQLIAVGQDTNKKGGRYDSWCTV